MRHILPSESSVMREFERIAASKGWAVKLELDAETAVGLRKAANTLGKALPQQSVALDALLPLDETKGDGADLRYAMDALRMAAERLGSNIGREDAADYHAAYAMLESSDGDTLLAGLDAMRKLVSQMTHSPSQQPAETIETSVRPEAVDRKSVV